MSRRIILKDNHPTSIKFAKLTALADDLGIHMEFGRVKCVLTDKDQPGIDFLIEDTEDADVVVTEFPQMFEGKIVAILP